MNEAGHASIHVFSFTAFLFFPHSPGQSQPLFRDFFAQVAFDDEKVPAQFLKILFCVVAAVESVQNLPF
jgi:hypothetical protein